MGILKIKPHDGMRILIPGDLHFPYCDEKVAMLMLDAAEDWGVTDVVLQGDTFECSALGKHQKSAKRQIDDPLALEDEGRSAVLFFDRLQGLNLNSCTFIPGNHEQRCERHAADYPALAGLTLRSIFGIPDFIDVLDYRSRVRVDSLCIAHGETLKGSLGTHGAQAVLKRYPNQTTLYGHTHRIQYACQTTYDDDGQPKVHAAMSIGHLADINRLPDMDYGHDENWQQGFALVEFWAYGEPPPKQEQLLRNAVLGSANASSVRFRYSIQQVMVHRGQFMANGIVYGA